LVIEKGRGDHEIDFTSYKISKHTVFFIRPGQVHKLNLKAGSSGFILKFKDDFYYPDSGAPSTVLRKVSNKNFCKVDATRYKKLNSLLASIFEEYSHQQEGYQGVIKANLDILFTELVRQKGKAPSDKTHSYAQDRLEGLFSLIETKIVEHKQVAHYADMLNLSIYQLNAITKRTLGKTGSEVINEHIILEAKRNLLATPNQVNQIAYELGYEDVSYFIRFFKKHTGLSPDAFRRNFK